MNRCSDVMGTDACQKDEGHDGLHRKGEHVWGFTNRIPEWRRKAMEDFAKRGWVAVKATDPA